MISEDRWLYLQRRASSLVAEAIKKGVIKPIDKEVKCIDCGNQAIGYDHRDYTKPLEIEPVCKRCNRIRPRALPEFKKMTCSRGDFGSIENVAELDTYTPHYNCYVPEEEAVYNYYLGADFELRDYDVYIAMVEIGKYPKVYR